MERLNADEELGEKTVRGEQPFMNYDFGHPQFQYGDYFEQCG